MTPRIRSILVLGLGKIGFLVAELLDRAGFAVTGADLHPPASTGFPVVHLDVTAREELGRLLDQYDAVLSCLPFSYNKEIAGLAHNHRCHYFDLTEDVATTRAIRTLADSAEVVLAPQCGLAPGFIAIVGASLAAGFDKLRSMRLRVGALPQHPTGLLGYAFNWSPEGVVNEYLNDCEVIEEGQHKWVSAMEWLEPLVIDGIRLEAFTTSGGLGTMCETFLGRTENLDYKSIRYPGHCAQMNFFFHELLLREQRELAGKILTHAKPAVNDDVVFVHVAVEGWKRQQLLRDEYVRAYYPITIRNRTCRAIAWTTAASVCAVVELVAAGTLPGKGFQKQETIRLNDFLATRSGRLFSEHERRRVLHQSG